MSIEIVDFPINNGDFPVRYVNLPEGIPSVSIEEPAFDLPRAAKFPTSSTDGSSS